MGANNVHCSGGANFLDRDGHLSSAFVLFLFLFIFCKIADAVCFEAHLAFHAPQYSSVHTQRHVIKGSLLLTLNM